MESILVLVKTLLLLIYKEMGQNSRSSKRTVIQQAYGEGGSFESQPCSVIKKKNL